MKRTVKPLYGMKGYPNQARMDTFKADLFEYGVDVPIMVDTINENTSGSGVTIDGVLLKDGTITLTAPIIQSVDPAITAHAGGTKAAAFALTEETNVVTVCATALDSLLLPVAVVGLAIKVINLGVATCAIYGAGTNTIDDIATANPFILQPEAVATFNCYTTSKWQSNAEAEGVYDKIYVDTIAENTSATGVTIDSVLLKDGGVTLAPTGNTSPITITGTNVTTGHIIDFNALALTSGSLIDIAVITTKVSGYLYNGSMTTSTLTGSTLLDDFSVSCAHDGIEADTLRMIRRGWTGNLPNGTLAADFVIAEFSYSGTAGTAQSRTGSLTGVKIDLGSATINDSALSVYGLYIDPTVTNTSSAGLYGIYMPGGGVPYIPLQVGTKASTAGSGLKLAGSGDNSAGVQLYFDDGGASVVGEVVTPIRARMLVTVNQTSGTSVCGSYSQIVSLGTTGATKNLTTGAIRAAYIFNQVGALTMTSAAEVAGINQAITVAGNTTVDTTSTFCGVDINIRGAGTVTPAGNGVVSGLYIRSSETAKWTTGIKLADAAATTAIVIGSCTTGITFGNIPTGISFTDVGATTEHLIDVVDAYLGMVIETGTYSTDTADKGITITSTGNPRPVSFLFDDSSALLGANVEITPVLSRMLFTLDQTVAEVRFAALQGHIQANSGIDFSGDTSEYFATEGILEFAGATTVGLSESSDPTIAGVCGMIWADGTLTATNGLVAGVMAKLYQTAGNTTNVSAFMATKWWNSNDTWSYGLYLQDSSIDTGFDIRLQSGALIGSGSAAPSHSAVQGSLYIRIGQGYNATLYLNTNGSTAWQLLDALH